MLQTAATRQQNSHWWLGLWLGWCRPVLASNSRVSRRRSWGWRAVHSDLQSHSGAGRPQLGAAAAQQSRCLTAEEFIAHRTITHVTKTTYMYYFYCNSKATQLLYISSLKAVLQERYAWHNIMATQWGITWFDTHTLHLSHWHITHTQAHNRNSYWNCFVVCWPSHDVLSHAPHKLIRELTGKALNQLVPPLVCVHNKRSLTL